MMTDDGQSVAKLKLATQRKSRLPSEQRGWSTTRRVAQEHDYPTTISGKKDPPISSSKNKLKTLSWKEWRKLERDRKEKEEDEQTLAKVEAPIPQSNIRFKLLKQMGYMPGAALGKKGLGRAEPVGIEIRRLRAGIGLDDPHKVKRKKEEIIAERKKRKEEDLMQDFGLRQKS
ncbi:hypothetical protein S83_019357 [Arachis hypogaea]